MEILQTIWNVLTNENEIAMAIISIPCIVLEAYLYMLIFLTLLKIDSTKKQRIMFVACFSLISILNSYFGIAPFNTFINVFSMLLLVLLIFKSSILKAILSEIITYIIVILISSIFILLYSGIFKVSSTGISTIPIHRICFSLLFYSALYIVSKLSNKFNINSLILDRFKVRNSLLLIINFIIGAVAIGLEYYLLFNYVDIITTYLVFLSLFVVSLYFVLSMFSLIRTNSLEATKRSLEEQKMYNEHLKTMHDRIRGFKHDFNNIIQAFGGYLSSNNIDGLKSYYKDLLEECQINNNLAALNPELINNPAIYGLLADKYGKAEKLNIKLNLEVLTDLSNLNVKMFELSRILGILLDNSIEAAAQCDRKVVNVIFRKDKKSNKVLIIIQNTYMNKDVNIDRIFEKGYTSKGDNENAENHGLGLWEVRKYLRKNTNLDLYTTKTDEFFTQQFEIYNL